MYRLFNLFWQYNMPRWLILLLDTLICAFSLFLAFALRFDFTTIPETDAKNLPIDFAVILITRFVSFAISKTYKGVVRYTSSKDTIRIFSVLITGSLLVFISNLLVLSLTGAYYIPNSVIII